MIYSLLLTDTVDTCPLYITWWEDELSKHFTSEAWASAFTISLKVSKCINHFELMRKIHLQWYLTPVRFANISSSTSHLCWRQCSQIGTLLHMWWSCPRISSFWRLVSDLFTELTNIHIPLTPKLAFLDIDIHDITSHFQTVVHHVLFTARISIARL